MKEGKKKNKAEKVIAEEVVEKVKLKVKEEKSPPPKLSKAALKEEVPPKEERPVRGKKDQDKEGVAANKKELKKDLAKANKEKDKPVQEAQVEVVTVGTILDSEGNKIWICPACAKPDDGSPMIGYVSTEWRSALLRILHLL